MALITHTLVLVSCLLVGFGSDAVQIQITPDKLIATMENNVQISCIPDQVDEGKEITLFELSRNNQDPLVFFRQCGKMSFSNETSSQFQAVGHIDKDSRQSYLNVTLQNPESKDTGIYTCVMYYLDKAGHVKTETSSGNLLVEKLDVESFERLLNQMKDRITKVEDENTRLLRNEIKDIHDKDVDIDSELNQMKNRIKNIENGTDLMEMEIKTNQEKASFRSAFFATKDGLISSTKGHVILFPLIIMQEGDGYNGTTGVFTSPRTGLYNFHLVANIFDASEFIKINLMLNDQSIGRLYVIDKTYEVQSSISIVVKLGEGDTVKPVVFDKHSDGRLYGTPRSYFSGYLIQLL